MKLTWRILRTRNRVIILVTIAFLVAVIFFWKSNTPGEIPSREERQDHKQSIIHLAIPACAEPVSICYTSLEFTEHSLSCIDPRCALPYCLGSNVVFGGARGDQAPITAMCEPPENFKQTNFNAFLGGIINFEHTDGCRQGITSTRAAVLVSNNTKLTVSGLIAEQYFLFSSIYQLGWISGAENPFKGIHFFAHITAMANSEAAKDAYIYRVQNGVVIALSPTIPTCFSLLAIIPSNFKLEGVFFLSFSYSPSISSFGRHKTAPSCIFRSYSHSQNIPAASP
jgi:hypothetical protein